MRPQKGKPSVPAKTTDWNRVADWYDDLVGESGSEYHREVVFPGVLRLLAAKPGDRVLDVACGQGALCRLLHERGMEASGVDAAPKLIDAARERNQQPAAKPAGKKPEYRVGDARQLGSFPAGHFAGAVCVLAIQNIHPFLPVFEGMSRVLAVGGKAVVVMMHPAFRGPKFSSWGWDETKGVQYRRVERYLLPRKEPIVTHPGKDPNTYTWSFHRPTGAYVKAFRAAGLLVDALEEWPSHKVSEPHGRGAAENLCRKEIPMFLALRAIKVPGAIAPEPQTPAE